MTFQFVSDTVIFLLTVCQISDITDNQSLNYRVK